MDVAQNSITAKASLITISVAEDTVQSTMDIGIEDNGCGMDEETAAKVVSPFYTTRTTRKVGLGVPFFKMSAEQTGGNFSVWSKQGEGTRFKAHYKTNHIDMMPLGDINDTMLLLISCNPDLDFVFQRSRDKESFTLDTRELREQLGDVPLNNPDVVTWMKEYLAEAQAELDNPDA